LFTQKITGSASRAVPTKTQEAKGAQSWYQVPKT
jgi:hypothetical protein